MQLGRSLAVCLGAAAEPGPVRSFLAKLLVDCPDIPALGAILLGRNMTGNLT